MIEQIHANLTPWAKLQDEVFVCQQFGDGLPKLVGLRENLMLGLYRGDVRCRRMLRYIEEFSAQKAADYQSLLNELNSKKDPSPVERQTLDYAMSRLIQGSARMLPPTGP